MRPYLSLLFLILAFSCSPKSNNTETPISTASSIPMANSVHDFTMNTLEGKPQNLKDFAGKVLVLVNVASKCGYTPQYADLQKFYEAYKDQGVVVLGFPANNFGGQEPGSDSEIAQFCQTNYGVTFPMFSKISVKGSDAHPLYKYLTQASGSEVSWNFNKFIVDKQGKFVKHFKSAVKPDDKEFIQAIKESLAS